MKKLHKLIIGVFVFLSIASSAHGFTLMAERTNLFEKRDYQSFTGLASFNYYLLKPAAYDARKSYPLVLTLPGASGHSYGAYILAAPSMQQQYPAFVLVPSAQVTSWTLPIYTDLTPEPSEHIIKIIKSLQKEFSIDPKRIYVTGYSVGGFGTFEMAAEYADVFAAAAPLCGGGNAGIASKLTRMPLWVFHGTNDPGIPVTRSRDMVASIKQAGGNPGYTEYPNVGHNVWEYAYKEPAFWQWMFSQRKP